MLDYLGVPHIQSCGEAEATCAALNALGVSNMFNALLLIIPIKQIFSSTH